MSDSPDYSWIGVWRLSGLDHIRTLTWKYRYQRFPVLSGVEIHLSGEWWDSLNTRVELA